MRVFIALELPQKVKDNLERSSRQFAEYADGGNFVPKENMHLTLHFLGNVDPNDLIYIQSAMDGVRNMPAPTLSVTQFAMQRASDIVWAKIRQSAELNGIHDALGEKLEANGFETEHRAYRPHVTIIRKKSFILPFSEVTKSVQVFNMPFTANKLTLFESVFAGRGVTYRPLYTVELPSES